MRYAVPVPAFLAALLCGAAAAAAEPDVRYFNVRALMSGAQDWAFSSLRTERMMLAADPSVQALASSYGVSWYDTLPVDILDYDPPVGLSLTAWQIEQLLLSFIPDADWLSGENSIGVDGVLCFVNASPTVLRDVQRLLACLEARSLRRVDLTLALVPPDALRAAVQADGPLFSASVAEKAMAAAGARGARWRGVVMEGEPVRSAPSAHRVVVGDYDVRVRYDGPSLHAIHAAVPSGLTVWARLVGTPVPELLRCECLVGLLDGSAPGVTRDTVHGTLTLPETAGTLFLARVLIPVGKTVVLGEVLYRQTRLVALARALPASASPAADVSVHSFEVGPLVCSQPTDRAYAVVSTPRFTPEALERFVIESLSDLLPPDPGPALRCHDATLFLTAGGDRETAAHLRHSVGALLRDLYLERATPCYVRVVHGDVDRAQLEGLLASQASLDLLPEGWRSQLDLADAAEACVFVEGSRATTVWSGKIQMHVASIEQVTVREGAHAIDIADPEVRAAPSAFCVTVTAEADPRTGIVTLDMAGASTETLLGATAQVRTGRIAVEDAQAPPWVIDLPRQHAQVWRHELHIPSGRACVARQVAAGKDAARVNVVIVEPRIIALLSR